ncbi:unnamed protein product, partial [Candidula unifasciata]
MDWDEQDLPTATTTAPVKKGMGRGSLAHILGEKIRGIGRGQVSSGKPADEDSTHRVNGARTHGPRENGDHQTSRGGFGARGVESSFGSQNKNGSNFNQRDDASVNRKDDGISRGGFSGGFNRRNDDSASSRGGFGGGRTSDMSQDDDDHKNGFSSGRGSFGNRPERGGRQGSREGDWKCPDADCGNINFAFRQACQKCSTEKPEDSESGGSSRGRFGQQGTDRPRGAGFGRGGTRTMGDRTSPNSNEFDDEKPQTAPYIPPAPSDKEEDIFHSDVHKGINFDKYDDIPVEVSGRDQCGLISSFDEAGFFPTFLRNVKRANYTKPTPIQKYSIPIIMAGRDLMACAQTGSGKTAAFLLPVLTAMVNQGLTTDRHQSVQTPQAVCVAPTRELAIQIYTDCRKFAFQTDIRPVVLYGGTSLSHQMRELSNGANIVIGTPGRLLDVINRGKISLANVSFLILDEADRMLDMGFEPEIRKMVETMGMPPKTQRQTLMFSATFPEEIQKLAADFLNDYLFVTVGRVGGANTDVSQHFFQVDRLQKRESLCDILNAGGGERTLVFVEMKRNADFLASYLCQSGFPTTSIHGDRLQKEREEALADFKSGKANVLVATSVAARGLDIPEVMHVINYDLPASIDEYVHRIGRTGRCGNLGKATSFFSADADQLMAAPLVKILKEAQQTVPDWLSAHACGMGAGDTGNFTGRFGGKDIRRGK